MLVVQSGMLSMNVHFYVNPTQAVRLAAQKSKNHVCTGILMSRFERTAYHTCAIRDRRAGLSCRKSEAPPLRDPSSGGSLEPGVLEPYLTEKFQEDEYTHIRLVWVWSNSDIEDQWICCRARVTRGLDISLCTDGSYVSATFAQSALQMALT